MTEIQIIYLVSTMQEVVLLFEKYHVHNKNSRLLGHFIITLWRFYCRNQDLIFLIAQFQEKKHEVA